MNLRLLFISLALTAMVGLSPESRAEEPTKPPRDVIAADVEKGFETERARLKAQLESGRAKEKKLKEDLEELNKRLRDVTTKTNAASEDEDLLSADDRTLRAVARRSGQTVEELKTSLRESRASLKQFRRDRDRLTNEADTLQDKIDAAGREIRQAAANVDKQIAAQKREVDKVFSRHQDFLTELNEDGISLYKKVTDDRMKLLDLGLAASELERAVDRTYYGVYLKQRLSPAALCKATENCGSASRGMPGDSVNSSDRTKKQTGEKTSSDNRAKTSAAEAE